MSKRCAICGKGPVAGRSIARRGMAKKKGGVGKRILRVTKRVFYPNVQKAKTLIKGTSKTITVCTKCIKKGKLSSL